MRRIWRSPADGPLPRFAGTRPGKAWRYVGAFGPELSLCLGVVRIGVVRQAFWALWLPAERTLLEGTLLRRTGRVVVGHGHGSVGDGAHRIALRWEPAGAPLEVASAHGANAIWTRKTPVRVTGEAAGRPVALRGMLDESAGHHARHTAWTWSCGAGVIDDGREVWWNLVDGVHDGPQHSERAVWVDGVPRPAGPVAFAADLSAVDGLRFAEQARRARHDDFGLLASDYEQPFGTFSGSLPAGAGALREGWGVMERHTARW